MKDQKSRRQSQVLLGESLKKVNSYAGLRPSIVKLEDKRFKGQGTFPGFTVRNDVVHQSQLSSSKTGKILKQSFVI